MKQTCISCEIVTGVRAPVGGAIVETAHFHAHQDIAYPVPGLVIVAAKRHVVALDELTPNEVAELLPLAARIRRAQREVLGVEHTYYFYNEDTTHHFHLWMVPRYAWMTRFGRSIESVRPALLHARDAMSGDAEIAELTQTVERLRQRLASFES
jgi:diadenosine tetraphosphate (Ap4A) HIT family hydrolase